MVWPCADASQGVQLNFKVAVMAWLLRTPWKVKDFLLVSPLSPKMSYLFLYQKPKVLIK